MLAAHDTGLEPVEIAPEGISESTHNRVGRLTRKEGNLQAQGETLLRELVDYEKSLAAEVDGAREKAAKIIRDAEDEARTLLTQARSNAEKHTEARLKDARTASERARKEVLDEANQAVSSLRDRAKKHKDDAVKLILERVLP